LDFLAFDGPVRLTPALRAAHGALGLPRGAPLGELVATMSGAMRERYEYQKDVTRYDSTTEDFLTLGRGVCQDFAHLMLGWLRLSGIPCRYVSGYLHVDRRKREPSQSHAWVEFHAPSAGWVAFDPTHGRPVDERYVVVGHGRHYDDVPPNKGIYRGTARETLTAEIYTRVVAGTAIPRIGDDVRAIDLKTFAAARTYGSTASRSRVSSASVTTSSFPRTRGIAWNGPIPPRRPCGSRCTTLGTEQDVGGAGSEGPGRRLQRSVIPRRRRRAAAPL